MHSSINILTFDNHWLFLGILYLCFLAVSAFFLVLSAVIGGVFKLKNPSFIGLFHRLLVGLSLTTVCYAIYNTSGATSLIPLLFYGAALLYMATNSTKEEIQSWVPISKEQALIYFLFGTGLFALFSTLLFDFTSGEIRYLHHSEFTHFGVDSTFYVRLGEYLNLTGTECLWADFYSYNNLERSPYHWFELWFGALVYKVLPVNSESLWAVVVNPTLFLFLIIGVVSISEKLIGSTKKGCLAGLIVLIVGSFGFLIPKHIWLIGEFSYSMNILTAMKTIQAYIGAAAIVSVAVDGHKKYLPFLFSFYGLTYLPILPVAFMAAGLIAFFVFVSEREREERVTVLLWGVSTMLTVLWFWLFFSESGISYSQGKGMSSGIFHGFEALQFLKVFARSILEMVIPNIPIIPLIVLLWIYSREKNFSIPKLWSVLFGAIFTVLLAGFAFALLYKMVDSRQVWMVTYSSFHGVVVTTMLTYGIFSRKLVTKVYSVAMVVLFLLNCHIDLGIGNNTSKQELIRLSSYLNQDMDGPVRLGHFGSAADTGIKVGGIHKYALHVHYPLKQLGLIQSPYSSANLSALALETEAAGRLGHVEQKMINISALKRFAVSNNLEYDENQVVREFVIHHGITHLVVPNEVNLPESLEHLTGDAILFFETKVYKVLTLPSGQTR